MSVGRLIDFFESFEGFPVRAEDVEKQVLRLGVQDCIEFHPMSANISPDDLLGLYKRFRWRAGMYGEPLNCSHIFYNVNVVPDEQNFICIKELMHVFDDGLRASVSSKDSLHLHLITLLKEEAPPQAALSALLDKAAEYIALAVMLPTGVRQHALSELKQDRATVASIAEEFGVPLAYMVEVLSDRWERLLVMLKAL